MEAESSRGGNGEEDRGVAGMNGTRLCKTGRGGGMQR